MIEFLSPLKWLEHSNILTDDGDTDIYLWCNFQFYNCKKSFPRLHREQVLNWTNKFEFFDIFQFPSRGLLDLASQDND